MPWVCACVLAVSLVIGSATFGVLAQSAQPSQPAATTVQKDIEISVLRAQLEVMRQYDQRLMATVYWSLGGLVAVAAILIGFGWFANFRVYERDKAALKETLESEIRATLTRLETELRSEASEARADTAKRALEAVKTEAEKVRSDMDARFGRVNQRFARSELLMNEKAAEEWSKQRILANAVRSQNDALKAALSMGHPYWVSAALDKLHEYLKTMKLAPTVSSLDAYLMREVEETLGKVAEEHAIAVAAVRNLMTAIRSG